MSDILKIGKYEFNSRLIVGSGKYKDFQTTKDATIASGSELITVAIRRVNITNPNEENLLDYFKDTNVKLLPNSAGCFTAEEAITTFRLMREATGIDIIKLEVIGDAQKTLYPDVIETIKACEILKKDGFTIMAYTSDDPIIASSKPIHRHNIIHGHHSDRHRRYFRVRDSVDPTLSHQRTEPVFPSGGHFVERYSDGIDHSRAVLDRFQTV